MKNMKNKTPPKIKITKQILRRICLAQACSDAGKNIYDVHLHRDNLVSTRYRHKEDILVDTLKMIDSVPPCGIYYYLKPGKDQNGFRCILVFFDIKVDGTRRQISFHVPRNKAWKLKPWLKKGSITRFNHNKTSRQEAKELAQLFDL